MSESFFNYQENSKKIKKLEKSFTISSLIVAFLVVVIVAVGFYYNYKVLESQNYIRKINKVLVKQSNIITQVSVLGVFLDNSARAEDPESIKKKLATLIKKLNESEEELSKLILKADNVSVRDLQDFLKQNQVETKLDDFISKANVIISPSSSNEEIRQSIQFLAGDNREGGLAYSDEFLKLLDRDYIQGMRSLERIGFLVIFFSLLILFVVWFTLFRPLSKTILEQNRQILDSSLQIESVSRSRTEFLANISHEIRTPMTGILGYAEHLEEQLDSPEHKKSLKIINQNAAHLLNLLDDILDMSKVKAAKFDLSKERVSLETFLKTSLNLMRIKAEDKGLDFQIKLSENLPTFIEVDDTRLRQIIFNIVGNAIKFTSSGKVVVEVEFHKRLLRLLISDTGPGIDQEKEEAIFKPFEQARTQNSKDIGGTGLGLSLSKGLAERMGGDVRLVRNEMGKGCTFELTLNVASSNEGETKHPEVLDDSDIKNLKGNKVLLVDDSQENLNLFKIQLNDSQCELYLASSGLKALELAKKYVPDIILLDLQMPEKDGYTTLEELREQGYKGPVLALTAHASEEERRKTKSAGFRAHITKPIQKNELINTIFKYLA